MDLRLLEDNTTALVTVIGEFDAGEATQFRQAVEPRLGSETRDFVVDLSGVESISSAALESLLWLESTVQERLGQIRLVGCNEDVRTVLHMTRLADRLPNSDTVENARLALR